MLVAALGIAALFSIAAAVPNNPERWPAAQHSWQDIGAKSAAKIKSEGRRYHRPKETYRAEGEYLWFSTKVYKSGARIRFDPVGIPKVKYGEKFYYNAVTTAQYALTEYNKHLIAGADYSQPVLSAADKLIEIQSEDGSFRYHFEFPHYAATLPYAPGWFSGMAQGQALSAFARAYKLTGDQKYIEAGNKSLAFLQVSHPKGPMTDMGDLDPSLRRYIFFMEYPTEPNVYTLNGYIFTLLGLYDWSQIAGSDVAGDLFNRGAETLEKILPYYDIGGFTSYDLGHLTLPVRPLRVARKPRISTSYHKVHIELLHAMYTITGNETFAEYEKKWYGYVW